MTDRATRIGSMRELIAVQRPARTADNYGGNATVWAVVYNLPARAQSVRGKESDIDGRRTTIESYLFVVRYGVTINTTDRIQWNGRFWNVLSVADREGTRRYLTIEAEAGSAKP